MGALDGLRVIDFGQYMAGPLAGMMLADNGADVIRVDPPSGPMWDTPANAVWNRGKRRISLDLKTVDGRRTAQELIASADVVIENFRPGVMDRLGLGAEESTANNDRLIYLSMPGFASDDERAAMPGWEGVVSAGVGTYSGSLERQYPSPVYTAVPIASSYAAFVGCAGVAMALVARERDGFGQRIEASLHDSMYQAIGIRGLKFLDRDAPGGPVPWVGPYECRDGRWVFFHAAYSHFIRQFCIAAGVPQWLDEPWSKASEIRQDFSLADVARAQLTNIFLTRTAQEWEDLINEAGPPTVRALDSAEWLLEPHAREAEIIVELDDPEIGPMLQPGIQVRMSKTPGEIRGPRKPLDADQEDILSELQGAAPAAMRAPGNRLSQALEGMTALDLCIILAGPTCGRTLAEFGADVVKIDNPFRENGILLHEDINRGKRSVLLDLKREEGRELFMELAADVDVVVQNYRLGKVGGLGVEYESVKQINPNVIYASLNAFGEIGPWAHRAGWEQLAQSASGMLTRYGDTVPTLQPFAINDYGTGINGAFAVGIALYHRLRTGEGQQVFTALARTASTLQSNMLHGYEGKRWDEPAGQSALGEGPAHRLYEASDGWLFVGAHPDQADQIPSEDEFRTRTVTEWVVQLTAFGIGAAPVGTIEDAMTNERAVRLGFSVTREHEGRGRVRTNGPSIRMGRTPTTIGRPAMLPGSAATEVLGERSEDLSELGVVVAADAAGG
ncbi:MAG: CoA transferase [Chloroflexi bacterium]|nr:CoA transferase [Chloroflexota bacterium]MCY3696125.1 CoA transferase [Chloroflexota bacterium]